MLVDIFLISLSTFFKLQDFCPVLMLQHLQRLRHLHLHLHQTPAFINHPMIYAVNFPQVAAGATINGLHQYCRNLVPMPVLQPPPQRHHVLTHQLTAITHQ